MAHFSFLYSFSCNFSSLFTLSLISCMSALSLVSLTVFYMLFLPILDSGQTLAAFLTTSG